MPEPFVQSYEVTVRRYKNIRGRERPVGYEKVLVQLTIDIDSILEHHSVRAVRNQCRCSRAGHVLVKFLKKLKVEEATR